MIEHDPAQPQLVFDTFPIGDAIRDSRKFRIYYLKNPSPACISQLCFESHCPPHGLDCAAETVPLFTCRCVHRAPCTVHQHQHLQIEYLDSGYYGQGQLWHELSGLLLCILIMGRCQKQHDPDVVFFTILKGVKNDSCTLSGRRGSKISMQPDNNLRLSQTNCLRLVTLCIAILRQL